MEGGNLGRNERLRLYPVTQSMCSNPIRRLAAPAPRPPEARESSAEDPSGMPSVEL